MDEKFMEEKVKKCEGLMKYEVKQYLTLSLNEKISKTKKIIESAIQIYSKIGLGFSGGTDSLVLLHMALQIKSDIPIIFVNTWHQFPKTYEFIKKIKKDWDLKNFYEVKAEKDKLKEIEDEHGFKTPAFTEICCKYHKINPMLKAIKELGLNAFLVALRGVEHEERAKESIFSQREGHFRVHPLLFWRSQDVLDYVKMFDIECNPLYAEGYTSLGCVHCTEKNLDPNAHERAGRGVVREEIMERLRELGYT